MAVAIYNEDNPAGFNIRVLEMQEYLACLNFMEGIFGVATVQVELRDKLTIQDNYLNQNTGETGVKKYQRVFPQGRKLGQNVDLSIDDSYASRLFFVVNDPISVTPSEDNYDWTEQNPEIRQPFSIIFHCNLDKIGQMYRNKNDKIDNDPEKIKLSILYALQKSPSIKIDGIYEDIDNVWKGYSMTAEMQGFGMHPYYCLKITGAAYFRAFQNNGGNLEYKPEINFDENKLGNITPNTEVGYGNVN